MKKLLGVLGIAVVAMTMFFNTNSLSNSTGDFDLTTLLTKNTAFAEQEACVTPIILHSDGLYIPTHRLCYQNGEACGVKQECNLTTNGTGSLICQSTTCLY